MKVTRILHHSVNVEGRLTQSTDFYRDLFTMPVADRPHIPGIGGHWFGAGDAQVHLVDAAAGDGPIRPAGPHVCFAVTDLDGAVKELEGSGIPYVAAAQGSTKQIWFVDPAGNTIEIQQDPGVDPSADRATPP